MEWAIQQISCFLELMELLGLKLAQTRTSILILGTLKIAIFKFQIANLMSF